MYIKARQLTLYKHNTARQVTQVDKHNNTEKQVIYNHNTDGLVKEGLGYKHSRVMFSL